MSTYFIGDVHGCYKNLSTMLDHVRFDPNLDTLHLTGDLVARGPNSLEVLRLVRTLHKSVYTVLGNHDLHLLKIYYGIVNHNKKSLDYFYSILNAPDVDELMYWLRHQSILYIDKDKKILMSHAGIHPKWNVYQAKKYAQEIESLLVSDYYSILLNKSIHKDIKNFPAIKNCMYSNNRLNQIQNHINVFTRMRYLYSNGQLNMQYKDTPNDTKHIPEDIYPWFDLSGLITPKYSIVFGHWASLKNGRTPSGIYGLDSGCCWGGKLTLLRWEDKKIIQIPCTPPA